MHAMNSLHEYINYREYIRDYYRHRKASLRGFSYRAFSAEAGFSSPVFIKLVIDGKANLSDDSAAKLAEAMGLDERQRGYFVALVHFNQAKSITEKERWLATLRAQAQRLHVTVLDADQYDYYKHWYHSALRELAPALQAGADTETLGRLLCPPLSVRETKRALKLLEAIRLLSRDEHGHFRQNDRAISTGSEVSSLAVRNLHAQMARLAEEALERVPKEQRDISGMTLGLSERAFGQLRDELATFRARVAEIVNEDSPTQRVYRLNLQLFPLSERIPDTDTDSAGEEQPES
ncbi:MAG: TIGR02147 family protein [Chitinivibrionales bacterium]|nr:TIGR02147 family protein [Chitinivibrionales bacterium]